MKGDRQREALVAALRDAGGGLDTSQLASRLGLHANTIRWHLGLLADAGLVRSAPDRRRRRGRPRVLYTLTPDGVGHDRDEYRLLATMLTDVVAGAGDGAGRAYEVGTRWGRDLQAAEPDAAVADVLDSQGFAAEARDDRIEMRRCPFYALAESSPAVVCSLHRGIIDGMLAASRPGERVARLDAFAEPGLCVAHLERR